MLMTFIFCFLVLCKIFVYYLLSSWVYPRYQDTLSQIVYYILGLFFTFTELRIIFKCQDLCAQSAKCVLISVAISSLAFFFFFIAELSIYVQKGMNDFVRYMLYHMMAYAIISFLIAVLCVTQILRGIS